MKVCCFPFKKKKAGSATTRAIRSIEGPARASGARPVGPPSSSWVAGSRVQLVACLPMPSVRPVCARAPSS